MRKMTTLVEWILKRKRDDVIEGTSLWHPWKTNVKEGSFREGIRTEGMKIFTSSVLSQMWMHKCGHTKMKIILWVDLVHKIL